ncbi:MAG: cell division protein ZapA, partial [Bacteroidota bacterium]|nr:cell division protein ZapA [Bacteroidota bacterium]
EVLVKDAIEEINARIRQYQSEFTRMDIHDCIRMALLTYAVDYHKVRHRSVNETDWNTLLDIQKELEAIEAKAI